MSKHYRRWLYKGQFKQSALKSFLAILWEYKHYLYLPAAMILLLEAFQMGARVFISEILSRIELADWGTLGILLVSLFVYNMITLAVDAKMVRVVIEKVGYDFAFAYEEKVLRHVARLGHSFNSSFPISVTLDRINKIERVSDLVEQGFWTLFNNIFQGLISLVVLMLYLPAAVPVVLVVFFLFIRFNNHMLRKQAVVRKRRKDRGEDKAEIRMRLVAANTTLLTNGALPRTENEVFQSSRRLKRVGILELMHVLKGNGIIRDVLLYFGRFTVLSLAVSMAQAEVIDIPRLVLIYTVSETMFIGMWGVVRFVYSFMYESPSILKIDELMEITQTVEEPDSAIEIPNGPLGYQFIDVDFTYKGIERKGIKQENPYFNEYLAKANQLRSQLGMPEFVVKKEAAPPLHLCGVTLNICPGEKVALVGHSGAGKSTLALLLSKLQMPNAGEILINGVPIADVDGYQLRDRIAVVPQGSNVDIFNDTLLYNITLGDTSYCEADVIEALKVAELWDTVSTWPLLLYETVGERGRTLSGGQQQRVAIARAAIRKPDLIILDEATSALDTETERLVQASLNRLLEGRTAVIIAHRLSTIRDADKIVVLKDGHISESGSWQELLAMDGDFAKLVKAQTL